MYNKNQEAEKIAFLEKSCVPQVFLKNLIPYLISENQFWINFTFNQLLFISIYIFTAPSWQPNPYQSWGCWFLDVISTTCWWWQWHFATSRLFDRQTFLCTHGWWNSQTKSNIYYKSCNVSRSFSLPRWYAYFYYMLSEKLGKNQFLVSSWWLLQSFGR